ncbi:MAG: 6-phosphofructokinase [Myxococcota bacterium]
MRIGVLTSGGDAPGMNATIRTVAKVAIARGHEAIGIHNGYVGLMQGNMAPLVLSEVDGISRLGGTILGSARSAEFRTADGRELAREQLELNEIDGLVVIGGNGSLAGAHALAAVSKTRIVGIPASIDNDIGHTRTAVGVDTAVNTIVEACDRITDTATAHRRAFIVEVMGRDNGFLALRSGLAAEADAVLITERKLDEDTVVRQLGELLKRSFAPGRMKRRVLIIKSEGVPIPTSILVERLRDSLSSDAPGVTIRETVLGHVVRGGSPSQADRVIAQRLAFNAAMALESDADDIMVAWDVVTEGVGMMTDDPRVRWIPLSDVLKETELVLQGTSSVTLDRIRLLERTEPVLAL